MDVSEGRGGGKKKINGYNNRVCSLQTPQWHQGRLSQQQYDGVIKMIEVCLERATVQIPGRRASMNQSQDTESWPLFFH